LHEKDRKILEIQQQKENFIAEVQVLFIKKAGYVFMTVA
jgi:hypothetical protein